MSTFLELVLRTNIYIQPIHFLLTINTNIINIWILSSKTLRSSPCTYYLLVYAVFSIIYACLVCPTQFLRGFYIDWASGKVGCKLHFFLLFLTPILANCMLLLASFDRFYLSIRPYRFRSSSVIHVARILILAGVLLCSIYMLPMLFIYNWDKTSNTCAQQNTLFANMYVFSQMILFYILSPTVVIILGLSTIYNIRQTSMRAMPLTVSTRNRRTEGQLTRMLLLQVGVHFLLGLPFGITYGINAFIPNTRTPNVLGVRYICLMWQQCDYFISFFLYVFSGRVYREELARISESIPCC